MATLREKLTFAATALAYVLFHLRLGADALETLTATITQMLVTSPYAVGFTYIIIITYRKVSGSERPPWDRILRVFFTIGILFGFFFALYEHASQGQPVPDSEQGFNVLRFLQGVTQKGQ